MIVLYMLFSFSFDSEQFRIPQPRMAPTQCLALLLSLALGSGQRLEILRATRAERRVMVRPGEGMVAWRIQEEDWMFADIFGFNLYSSYSSSASSSSFLLLYYYCNYYSLYIHTYVYIYIIILSFGFLQVSHTQV